MTTPSIDEQLSRYLEGDLPPDEAAALEARIASSPDLAAALEDL
ncbi:MAG: zf-HC2 domain-containing protein [Myxococcota bacterium]